MLSPFKRNVDVDGSPRLFILILLGVKIDAKGVKMIASRKGGGEVRCLCVTYFTPEQGNLPGTKNYNP